MYKPSPERIVDWIFTGRGVVAGNRMYLHYDFSIYSGTALASDEMRMRGREQARLCSHRLLIILPSFILRFGFVHVRDKSCWEPGICEKFALAAERFREY